MPLNIDLNTPLNELNTLPLNIDLNIPLNDMNTSNHRSNVPLNIDFNTSFNSSTNLYPLEVEDDIGIEFEANLSQEEEEEEDIGIEFEANLSQEEEEEEEDIFGFFDNNIDNLGNMVTGFFKINLLKTCQILESNFQFVFKILCHIT
ncbi:hypothetical protein P8452_32136 [Trifolium repens]|nr:hypothetical protein P8452_32136 [Trifolium repens]